ncbi:p-loop containing nucleoside triphosphate hydrolase protein [Mycena indigotica]|uniref:p-loop containing nucleoside triphosphate hydrolase protein n=1 Tax=Mycena indigotica TaxID=2126181 RepID=A0A8H6T9D4_9AGAR|nr:p-loop containing nucleoside triphosphate hydrolase protein [Mycena indigotica]KAF7311755.1 p-loop containing nucleoside triphosphate hydrolase protein [Mycena indigotica]
MWLAAPTMHEFLLTVLVAFLAVLFLWRAPVTLATSAVQQLLTSPHAGDLLRFVFLGTVMEAGRQLVSMLQVSFTDFFRVQAEFTTLDFAYDWCTVYLDSQHVWHSSRAFKVIARNANAGLRPLPFGKPALGEKDGHPDPIYEPTQMTPTLFRWRGYWITVTKTTAGYAHYDTGEEVGGRLIIAIWSRKRQILDDFVDAAREFYVQSSVLPRRVNELDKEPSGALTRATFNQSDSAFDWMLAYLRSTKALAGATHFTISTKQSDLSWAEGPNDAVRYLPGSDTRQQVLFTSPNTGRKTWLQVVINAGQLNWTTNNYVGGSISVTLYSSDRTVLQDLIETARQTYLQHGASRVTVHLADNRGEWAKTVTKARRPMNTLILPAQVKETLLQDATDFLASEEWYNNAGIPHRRGYLLYGEPGTGKSSTIHALAGALGLEIYFVSLANPGVDDYSLAKLISDTPARCIMLIEDIDCAFPSRDKDEDDDEEDEMQQPVFDQSGRPLPPRNAPQPIIPRSSVTLSGLLNVLDSVSSEEGRLVFATTNHIENLDSALIRPGRMDVKIQYRLADSDQLCQMFKRFFPAVAASLDADALAMAFAQAIPPHTYSIAHVQGYLLTQKRDPEAAVAGIAAWVAQQEAEKAALAEAKAKKREDRRRRRREREAQLEKERDEERAKRNGHAHEGSVSGEEEGSTGDAVNGVAV